MASGSAWSTELNNVLGPQRYTTALNPDDVLLGRGVPIFTYSGNVRFRQLVQERKDRYASSCRRLLKNQLAREIIAIVSQRGGRFVREVKDLEEINRLGVSGGNKAWVPVEDRIIMQKVKQALREPDSPLDSESTEKHPVKTCPPTTTLVPAVSSSSQTRPTIPDSEPNRSVSSRQSLANGALSLASVPAERHHSLDHSSTPNSLLQQTRRGPTAEILRHHSLVAGTGSIAGLDNTSPDSSYLQYVIDQRINELRQQNALTMLLQQSALLQTAVGVNPSSSLQLGHSPASSQTAWQNIACQPQQLMTGAASLLAGRDLTQQRLALELLAGMNSNAIGNDPLLRFMPSRTPTSSFTPSLLDDSLRSVLNNQLDPNLLRNLQGSSTSHRNPVPDDSISCLAETPNSTSEEKVSSLCNNGSAVFSSKQDADSSKDSRKRVMPYSDDSSSNPKDHSRPTKTKK